MDHVLNQGNPPVDTAPVGAYHIDTAYFPVNVSLKCWIFSPIFYIFYCSLIITLFRFIKKLYRREFSLKFQLLIKAFVKLPQTDILIQSDEDRSRIKALVALVSRGEVITDDQINELKKLEDNVIW